MKKKNSYPISVNKNNYIDNRKNSTIVTPDFVCGFLFNLVKDNIDKNKSIYDPACNDGNLLKPFFINKWNTIGTDIIDCDTKYISEFVKCNFLGVLTPKFKDVGLIICNPPFNDESGKYRKKLLPEIFFKRILNFYSSEIPIILFVPMGFRLNQKLKSKRWKFLKDCGAEITSIISLPIDIFKDVLFHSEIIIFNINGLKAHYFLRISQIDKVMEKNYIF